MDQYPHTATDVVSTLHELVNPGHKQDLDPIIEKPLANLETIFKVAAMELTTIATPIEMGWGFLDLLKNSPNFEKFEKKKHDMQVLIDTARAKRARFLSFRSLADNVISDAVLSSEAKQHRDVFVEKLSDLEVQLQVWQAKLNTY